MMNRERPDREKERDREWNAGVEDLVEGHVLENQESYTFAN